MITHEDFLVLQNFRIKFLPLISENGSLMYCFFDKELKRFDSFTQRSW